jgi:hypothetical protein
VGEMGGFVETRGRDFDFDFDFDLGFDFEVRLPPHHLLRHEP